MRIDRKVAACPVIWKPGSAHSSQAFNNIWLIELVFFAFYLLALGYLILRSGYIGGGITGLAVTDQPQKPVMIGALAGGKTIYGIIYTSKFLKMAGKAEGRLSIWGIMAPPPGPKR